MFAVFINDNLKFLFLEQDTISERDFACPAKRRRQEDNDELMLARKQPKNDIEFKFRIDFAEPIENFGKR